MITSGLARKSTIVLAFAAFAVLGVTVGLIAQRDNGTGSAANPNGETAADVRYIEVMEEAFGPGGEVESTARIVAWLGADGSRVRWETGSQEDGIELVTVLDGDTVRELRSDSDGDSYSELRVVSPYDAAVQRSRRPTFLVARDLVPPGQLREIGRELVNGRTVVTARAERPPEVGDEGGPPVTAYEVVYEEESGFAREMRFYTAAADGSQELLGGRRFRYEVDKRVAEDGIFTLEPPPGARIYRDIQWALSAVPEFDAFAVYYVGTAVEGAPLSVAQESQQENTPTGARHLFNFLYEDAGLTVTNQPASALAGTSRCEAPKAVAPGSLGDVVLEGNAACGYGTEIDTPLGRAVLRSDTPTVEIQLGQTVVFVHAPSEEAALDAASNLTVAN